MSPSASNAPRHCERSRNFRLQREVCKGGRHDSRACAGPRSGRGTRPLPHPPAPRCARIGREGVACLCMSRRQCSTSARRSQHWAPAKRRKRDDKGRPPSGTACAVRQTFPPPRGRRLQHVIARLAASHAGHMPGHMPRQARGPPRRQAATCERAVRAYVQPALHGNCRGVFASAPPVQKPRNGEERLSRRKPLLSIPMSRSPRPRGRKAAQLSRA